MKPIRLVLSDILFLLLCCGPAAESRPNIVFVLADDLGWGDVGWNNPAMADVTPHLTKLAKSGMVLSQYYVQQVCSPSRAALLTGLYPFHTGRQKGTIKPLQPTGLTLKHKLLSDSLKSLGYNTHMVGKWHLGFCRSAYLPTRRGFNSFSGYYTGAEHYFSHVRDKGYDFRKNENVDFGARGNYSTDLFNQEAVRIVERETGAAPFFLYLAYQATHAPLEAPVDEFRQTRATGNPERDVYRAMLARMDRGVGDLVATLKRRGFWENTILVFSTDNGGAVSMAGSNFPLRGTKGTLFEGGTRGAGFVAGGSIRSRGGASKELMHITDWMPTLLSIAGGRPPQGIDGVDHSGLLRQGQSASKRRTIVYNLKIKPVTGAIRVGDFKLMFAPKFNKDGWYNPDARPRKLRMVVRRKRMRRRRVKSKKDKNKDKDKDEQKGKDKEDDQMRRKRVNQLEEEKPRRRKRMVSPSLLAMNTDLEADLEKRVNENNEEEISEEEEEEDQEEEEEEEEDEDQEVEDEAGDTIKFDELEDPEEDADIKSTLAKMKKKSNHQIERANEENLNRQTGENLNSEREEKANTVKSSKVLEPVPIDQILGDNVSKEEPRKAKVKVKKRNIMSRAEQNEFPEFDIKDEGGSQTNVKEENENKKKEKGKTSMNNDNNISQADLVERGEADLNLLKNKKKKKKKKMRRIRVKMDKMGAVADENDEEAEDVPSNQIVEKRKKKKCKNKKGVKTKDAESGTEENGSESESQKCGGRDRKKKKQPSRYRNVKETKKRAFVKNLRSIGRKYNVRPSSSNFYGRDRDWSDRPRQNMTQSPLDVFTAQWPKLKKHLFNVRLDPEERNDLVLSRPDLVEQLREEVVKLLRTFVERDYPAPSNKGRPSHFNNVWSPGWC